MIYQLRLDKETENKYRWLAFVDDVAFKLYIPKHVLPEPVPDTISVTVLHGRDLEQQRPQLKKDEGVVSDAALSKEHTTTVQYTPPGDPNAWVTGEPYVPMSVLPAPWPKSIRLIVRWGKQ